MMPHLQKCLNISGLLPSNTLKDELELFLVFSEVLSDKFMPHSHHVVLSLSYQNAILLGSHPPPSLSSQCHHNARNTF